MPVTMQQVEAALQVDEPDYARAARLGMGAIPYLESMAREREPGLAAKAVYLATLIAGDSAAGVIEMAAQRPDPVARVAAAAALSHLSADRLVDIAIRLLSDREDGVRRRALEALPTRRDASLSSRLGELADRLPAGAPKDDVLRALRKVRQ